MITPHNIPFGSMNMIKSKYLHFYLQRLFRSLQIFTKHIESFVPDYRELCSGLQRALFRTTAIFVESRTGRKKTRICRALIHATGSFVQTTGSFVQTTGSFVHTTGSFCQTTGSFVQTKGSFVQTTGSFVQTTGSFVQTTGSFVSNHETIFNR